MKSVYFQGTADRDKAVAIEVREGEETRNIDVVMQSGTPVSITGHATLDSSQPPYSELRVTPTSPEPSAGDFMASGSWWNGVTSPPGQFKITGYPLAPGLYDVFAVLTGLDRDYFGSTPVVLGDQPLKDVVVQLHPGADVVGKVITRGDASKIKLTGLPMHLRSPAFGSASRITNVQNATLLQTSRSRTGVDPIAAMEAATPRMNADGTFNLRGVPRGTLTIVPSLPNGVCLLDVLQGGKSVLDSGVVVSSERVVNIDVVVSSECSTVQGNLRTDKGSRAFRRMTLVPNGDRRQSYGIYRTVLSDYRGQFLFDSVAPGQYKVFAWTSAPDGAWTNAKYLSEFEDRGVEVNATSGSVVRDLAVELIPESHQEMKVP